MLVTGFAIFFGLLSSRHQKAETEQTTFEELRGFDVFIEKLSENAGYFEKWTGYTIDQHRYRARLGYQQNNLLFKLTKLEYLVELDVNMDRNPTNLMQFDGLTNLEILRISEWYAPENLDGVQSLQNLQRLEIYDIESPDELDLTALENHPTLEIVLIDGHALSVASGFQEWEHDP